ncbi:hypothetical protein LCGC14_0198900, partial [marine sediment metagenome]
MLKLKSLFGFENWMVFFAEENDANKSD